MSLALLFPGQGAQHPKMLPWLLARPEAPPLQTLGASLGADWRTRLDDEHWLQVNTVAQPLLTALALAAWRVLAERLPRPVAIAGYSVGEVAAFAAAGVMDDAAALAFAVERAEAMSDCPAAAGTGLLALQGPRAGELAAQAKDLHLAIRIGADRVIVGGPRQALERQAAAWTAAGMRCTPLPISLASHTPALAGAADELALRLAVMPLQPPVTALVCNFTGTAVRQPAALAAALAGQVGSPVLWDDCMDSVAERQPRCVLEVGPGRTLAGMWEVRHPGIPVRSVDDFQQPEGVWRWVQQSLAD
ncbi:ACP S-malonyltransferase [Roseateles cellulosilyticus]|uniref:Acyltransferase domain-containing protein n=1 Tax=Pelomonas cellulosilytica TaxID=2906762 RepID=A0ABS8XYD6_9BURK|nr:acyltransferase domain-containing protein [Pelomonas sp. P8]MCE4557651.1 acyltransferase domain-containing protein [Pelomonas sp. P8]